MYTSLISAEKGWDKNTVFQMLCSLFYAGVEHPLMCFCAEYCWAGKNWTFWPTYISAYQYILTPWNLTRKYIVNLV